MRLTPTLSMEESAIVSHVGMVGSVKQGGIIAKRKRVCHYVGTDGHEGLIQYSILRSYGMKPSSSVLEIGCGALNASIPIMNFLDEGNYTGIDPNVWLRSFTLSADENLQSLAEKKRAKFLDNPNFDPEVNFNFDYIFGHSVLSHASANQFDECVAVLKNHMHDKSVALMSFRPITDSGYKNKKDYDYKEWEYPKCSFFSETFVDKVCKKHEINWRIAPEIRKFFIEHRKRARGHTHAWLEFRK